MARHHSAFLQTDFKFVLDKLKSFAEYNKDKGAFIRTALTKGPNTKQIIGEPVGSDKNGYLRVELLGHKWYISRLIWAEEYSEWPQGEIDHIDGDTYNNHISNLRVVDSIGNGQNKKLYSNNTTGYIGVKFHKRSGKYQAQVTINKKRHHIGSYFTAEQAAEARADFLIGSSFTQRHGES